MWITSHFHDEIFTREIEFPAKLETLEMPFHVLRHWKVTVAEKRVAFAARKINTRRGLEKEFESAARIPVIPVNYEPRFICVNFLDASRVSRHRKLSPQGNLRLLNLSFARRTRASYLRARARREMSRWLLSRDSINDRNTDSPRINVE